MRTFGDGEFSEFSTIIAISDFEVVDHCWSRFVSSYSDDELLNSAFFPFNNDLDSSITSVLDIADQSTF